MLNQRGVSLIITFLIMTIMLAIVLSMTTILFNKVNIISNMGSSTSALNSALSGVEKTLYFDRKQIPIGSSRGFCNICDACDLTDCNNCQATALSAGGCDATTCTNCRVNYNSTFDDRIYYVDATVTPNSSDPLIFDMLINSKGFYRDIMRTVEFKESN